MSVTILLLVLLLFVVTMLVGGGILVLIRLRPAWSAPVTGALAAMMLMTTVVTVLVTVTRS
ncbi:hypothetical protein OOK39_42400 [Streptomyces sp. NBC_00264]|uniref:hypothetical protein n=1 Tax=unclassified Streptomyces TaxID=2593676 RepID=UPI00224CE4DF|nr:MULTISPECIES: hypothetical protein [unclassified Streptomyces]MCX5165578.1 hypothetical protein [Streptomyces sp. NBC_00305]MCX5224289.1 hypothetical protein [Streptomyces sp. NBC_00264]